MRKFLIISIIFFFFTFLFTFPSLFNLSDKIIGDGGDSYQFLGFQYIAKLQVSQGKFPFGWTDYWRYPVGFDFSIGYDSTLFLLTGILFYLFIESPVIVYNLSILTMLFLNALLSYPLFKKVSGRDDLGILGSVIYGFSFYTIAKLGGHPNLILSSCFPFFIYGLINLKDRSGDKKSFVIFTLSVILVFFASLQYLLILISALLLVFPILLLFYKDSVFQYLSIFWKRKKYTIFSLLTSVCIFLFFNSGRIEQSISKSLIFHEKDYMIQMSPSIMNFLLPNDYLPLVITSGIFPKVDEIGIDRAVFLGYLEIFIFLCFILSRTSQKFRIFIFLNLFVFFSLSLGCKTSYQSIYAYCYVYDLSLFKGIAEPGRFYTIIYIFLTIGILTVLKRLRGFKRRLTIPTLMLFIVLERIPIDFYLSPTMENEIYIGSVKSLNSDAVLDLPLIDQWAGTRQKSKYDLYSVYYGKPIVNGYIQWAGNTPNTETFLEKFPCFRCGTYDSDNSTKTDRMLARILKTNNIKTIVLHKDLAHMDNGETYCDQALKNINFFLNDKNLLIDKVYEDNNKAVFQLL
ncbi:hypothetical protein A2771_04560 [Candidatus Woesebacteria bacterium RIFCSPHIGHO2_01_FULL_38_26b]|uniref:Glycosyltransferase RgtA/B/C/D-like domain-containing protein n=1 Tax=Candidatus Woesebacteria bacterium RIFCSPHIGHO2_01_FULL_38_26b TaxID=1802491 RepID=A0A1F7XZD3_9BACT|nr:MAG: hypothetical protein A2771_04560 [Candidatus Woesebacteria bacterium RIFCSPHIGHO2_01_FULL_38_26b]